MIRRSVVAFAPFATLLVLFLIVRHDFWWWSDSRRILGLPIGLAYHVAYCLAASAIMALLVSRAWPRHAIEESEAGE